MLTTKDIHIYSLLIFLQKIKHAIEATFAIVDGSLVRASPEARCCVIES